MTAAKPFQTLRAMLFTISTICGIGAILLFFASDWLLRILPGSVPPPSNVLELTVLKAFGIFLLALAYLLCVAARDPVRYVAVINALIFILLAAAVLNVYGLVALGLGAVYPAGYLVTRTIVQLILAAVIFTLRPKGTGGPLPAP